MYIHTHTHAHNRTTQRLARIQQVGGIGSQPISPPLSSPSLLFTSYPTRAHSIHSFDPIPPRPLPRIREAPHSKNTPTRKGSMQGPPSLSLTLCFPKPGPTLFPLVPLCPCYPCRHSISIHTHIPQQHHLTPPPLLSLKLSLQYDP